jgi:CHAT domain-containing protein
VDGELFGDAFGSAADALADARRLIAEPGAAAIGARLGAALAPEAARRGSGPLELLTIGPLGAVPLAALRDERGELLIARRPLARVLALLPRDPSPPRSERSVILADPEGDKPAARAEGAFVARAVGAGAALYGTGREAATRARLAEARHVALLHIGTEVSTREDTRALHLSDGKVSAGELLQLRLAPRLAVLAGCGSGAAFDDEGWGSLAAALLSTGTDAVIATDRTVGDDAALPVVQAFYRQPDWRADPASALARAQSLLAGQQRAVEQWASFGVLLAPPMRRR